MLKTEGMRESTAPEKKAKGGRLAGGEREEGWRV